MFKCISFESALTLREMLEAVRKVEGIVWGMGDSDALGDYINGRLPDYSRITIMDEEPFSLCLQFGHKVKPDLERWEDIKQKVLAALGAVEIPE